MTTQINNDIQINDSLLTFILSICNVTTQDFMTKSNQYHSQVKWLYWYACRYIRNETYLKISQRQITSRKQYTLDAVRKGVERMSDLINTDIIWKERWDALLDYCNARPIKQDSKIKLTIDLPRGIKKNDVEIYIKDKA